MISLRKWVLVAVLTAEIAHAQQPPSVIRLPDGRQVYVLGLRRWTVGMIQDSLAKYSPQDSLQSHACAAVLRYKLGFADASAVRLRSERAPDIVFVHVREPQDSARVHYREMALDSVNPDSRWFAVTSIYRASPRTFYEGSKAFLSHDKANDSTANALAAFLRARATEEDYRAALTTLEHSRNYLDRSVAALVLANFPQRHDTWAALLASIRESDGPVKSAAGNALKAIASQPGVRPNWHALAPQVHAILDGTSLFLLDAVIEVLNKRSDIGPEHAALFLANGGEMLLNRAALDQPMFSRPAHSLLVKLRGADLGADLSAWRAWVAQLRP